MAERPDLEAIAKAYERYGGLTKTDGRALLDYALSLERAAGEQHPALVTPPICGNTGLTEAVEARFRAIRAEKGESQEGGCGRNLPWLHAYRCLECGRFMCDQCLRQHFAEHGDQTAALLARIAQAERELDAANAYIAECSACDVCGKKSIGVYGWMRPFISSVGPRALCNACIRSFVNDALARDLAAAREALGFYADQANHMDDQTGYSAVDFDHGDAAIRALAAQGPAGDPSA